VELLAELGLDGTTIQAIADRAEVARATIYLRWPTREALITAALRHAIGRPPFPLTGDIDADVRLGGEQARWILSQPLFASVLPALVREFVQLDRAGVTFDTLFPNRKRVAEEYDRVASSQGFSDDIDGYVVVDLVVGALLLHLLATGTPPTDAHREQTVEVVLAGLRRRSR
jgi:AcrR family transcriptional regulator